MEVVDATQLCLVLLLNQPAQAISEFQFLLARDSLRISPEDSTNRKLLHFSDMLEFLLDPSRSTAQAASTIERHDMEAASLVDHCSRRPSLALAHNDQNFRLARPYRNACAPVARDKGKGSPNEAFGKISPVVDCFNILGKCRQGQLFIGWLDQSIHSPPRIVLAVRSKGLLSSSPNDIRQGKFERLHKACTANAALPRLLQPQTVGS